MNLAGSTGPAWSLKDLLALASFEEIGAIQLDYMPFAGSEMLRLSIAQMHGVDPEWVVVTNGATEALHLICAALKRPGSHALLPSPCYPAAAAIAQMHNLSVRYYALGRESHFSIDNQQILSLAAGGETAFVVVNTPHNPTGAVVGQSTSLRLADRLGERAIPLVVDEVFHPVYHGVDVDSVAGGANIILVGDLSKALSLPGLRIGWVIDSNAERRSRLRSSRGLMSLGGSPILERLAVIALENRHNVVRRTVDVSTRNLAKLQHFMARCSDILGWVPPLGGLVAFPWFHDGRNSRRFCERLVTKGVLLVPGDCFGMQECMRIGIGCEPEIFEAGLQIIENELGRA